MKKNKFKISKKEIVIVVITIVTGIVLGSLMLGGNPKNRNERKDTKTEQVHNEIWTCSMHPQIKQPEPGNCPICGMKLIPVQTNSDAGADVNPNEIQMTETAMKLANVQTYIVKKGVPEKQVELLGKVKFDERRIATLTARFGGRIEKLYVNYTGQEVKKGQKLASVYSPELNTAMQELLDASKNKKSNHSFYKATRNKLKLWEISDEQIDAVEKSKKPGIYFDILSPVSGIVTHRYVAAGNYVKEGGPLFEVVDLSQVWIMFDAYESDLPWIKTGDEVSFTVQSLPGKTFKGKVSYIDPFIDANTRVAKVRVEMDNKGMKFKPEMFVSGILHSKIAENTKQLLIPKTSILWTGKRSVVYVKVPDKNSPSFVYREITLGPEAGDFYVVAEGLKEGEEIASNGVFKIDAAAQLLGKPSMMNPEGGKTNTMPGMDMSSTDKNSSETKKTNIKDEVSFLNETDSEFKKQLGTFVNAYLNLKDAFVASDEKSVEKEAQNTLSALKNVEMKLLNGNAHDEWMSLSVPVRENLKGIIKMKGIEMKRKHFSIVSNKITEAIEKFGVQTIQTIYLEFCPMAFDNKGAYWISNQKDIRNPYFGDKMLTCGEVKKEFNSK